MLIDFLSFEVGAYSKGAHIRGGAYTGASIVEVIHMSKICKFCYLFLFTGTFNR